MYDDRQKNFIRDIQITHGMPKNDAIAFFDRMRARSAKDFKILEKTVTRRLEKYASSDSGGKRVHVVFTTNDFKKEQKKLKERSKKFFTKKELEQKEKVKKKVIKRKVSDVGKLNVSKWLKNKLVKKTTSEKTISRVSSAHIKYPDASKYELQHGVNSIASQNYRERNGKSRIYEGRIISK